MEFADMDSNSEMRKKISAGTIYIDTINPMELMTRFSLPHKIEYMSLDVEGAEFEFLSQIDLREFQIATMSIEHNHDADKKLKIRNLLSSNGYEFLEHFNDDFFGKSH
jgi:hypothetical protein